MNTQKILEPIQSNPPPTQPDVPDGSILISQLRAHIDYLVGPVSGTDEKLRYFQEYEKNFNKNLPNLFIITVLQIILKIFPKIDLIM